MASNPVPPRVPPAVALSTDLPPALDDASTEPIVANPDFWYRTKRYIMVLVLVGMGPWFAYDGWKNWPAENVQIADLTHQLDQAIKKFDDKKRDELNNNPLTHKMPHSNLAIEIQKILTLALPVAGLLFLLWTFRVSRGQYRLVGDVLEVPGHPPVNLHEINEIDRSRWDRKGIAYLRYKTSAGTSGKICLDDFIYDREPTDQIFARAQAAIA